MIERWVPVRLCCGTQHWGPVCPGGFVMCCICFGRFPFPELYVDQAGDRWDVCRTCGEQEEEYKRAHPTSGPSHIRPEGS